jgi:uncharacterized protein (DUF3084 family)
MSQSDSTVSKKELEVLKLKTKIQRAMAAKCEIELTILERKIEIQNQEEHLALQDKVIQEAKSQLESLEKH